MTETSPDIQPHLPGHKLSGTTWAALAFVAGTLFALLPMYYFYAGTTAPQRESTGLPTASAPDATPQAASEPSDRFAARMSYELSQTPQELPVRTDQPATASVVAPAAVAFQREAPTQLDERLATRVENARPISPTPPDPRDTTREIENEAIRAGYRASRVSAGEAVSQRSADTREAASAAKATRPIGMAAVSGAPQQEGELTMRSTAAISLQDRNSRLAIAKAGPVSGVSPIGPAPQTRGGDEPAQKSSTNGTAGVIESRLAATREWLNGAPQTMHTIQIMGASSEEQLRTQLRSLSKVLEPQKIYVFRTMAQGKPAMTVVYGGYADRQAALQALEKLPPSVSANRPVLRTVHGIRTELKQHGIKAES